MGADPAAEEQFGPYLVYERLGVGGMATVHRALERGIEGFERVVALKRLLPHLAADASFIKAFVREAKLASYLKHVNIVQQFELGRVGTAYFISMEYIDGRDLRRILRHARKVSGPPPIHVTVGILLQLCDALDYAHTKVDDAGVPLGLVHRDVSPSNVLVTSTGQVKVIDFGIAKAQGVQLRTQTGRVKGKLAYMAPEAVAGKELDERSDLFAAGVIAHELLTARPLFATKNEYQTLMKVQRGEIMPPSTFNQGCPAELDAIVLRALARDPDERFASAAELRDDLYAMRRQYGLHTAERDIVTWLDWAFSLEAPSGGFAANHDLDAASDLIELRAPRGRARPRRSEDDEVVDLAWGEGEEAGNGQPVLLDDVPDVSAKHLSSASALGAEVRLDLDDLADDMPTPLPVFSRSSPEIVRAVNDPPSRPTAAGAGSRPAIRARPPTPAPRLGVPVPMPAREPSQAIPTRIPTAGPSTAGSSTSLPAVPAPPPVAAVRSVMIPPRMKPATRPPRISPAGSTAPRTISDSALTPPRGVPTTPTPARGLPRATTPARGIAKASTGPNAHDRAPTAPLAGAAPRDSVRTQPHRLFAVGDVRPRADGVTERTPAFHGDDIGLASDTIPSMPALQTSESVVRFRPTAPPPLPDSPIVAPLVPSESGRLITPATALFAEPDEAEPSSIATSVTAPATPSTASGAMAGLLGSGGAPALLGSSAASSRPAAQRPANKLLSRAERAARRRARVRWLLLGLAGLGLAAAGAVITLRYLDADDPAIAAAPPSPAKRGAQASTVQLIVTPADAVVTVEGKPRHTGSPWQLTLEPGIHQIEISRTGYKGWLTSLDLAPGQSRVVKIELEALTSTVVADATLVVDSTPPALEAVIDGALLTARTPIKLPLRFGPHTIVLRQNGVEVWKQDLDVRTSSIYEYRPVIAEPAPAVVATPAVASTPAAPPAQPSEPDTVADKPAPAGQQPAVPPAPPPAPAPAIAPPSAVPDAPPRAP